MAILEEIATGIEKGDSASVHSFTEKALAQDISAVDILNNGLVSGMGVISEKFKNNEVFIPEVLVSAKAMKAGMELLKSLLAEANVESKGKVVSSFGH